MRSLIHCCMDVLVAGDVGMKWMETINIRNLGCFY